MKLQEDVARAGRKSRRLRGALGAAAEAETETGAEAELRRPHDGVEPGDRGQESQGDPETPVHLRCPLGASAPLIRRRAP